MWNNFCAVIEDLFWFALGAQPKHEIFVYGKNSIGLTPTISLLPPRLEPVALPTILLSPRSAPVLLPNQLKPDFLTAHTTSSATTKARTLKANLDTALSKVTGAEAILHAPVVMYVSVALGTACVQSPHIDFDSVIEILPYGTAVTVIGYQGRFASVNRSNITGWVLKDDISPQKSNVWPQFISGTTYDMYHEVTVQTRLLINDMFGAGALGLPLQAGEYITVRLKSEHRTIVWSRKRPRAAGMWAKLLRGTAGIHIGVSPKTDSIIEWQEEGGEGRLGYVDAVAADNTITIGAVGVGEAGLFTVKTMSEEVWRELRPVFIEVA